MTDRVTFLNTASAIDAIVSASIAGTTMTVSAISVGIIQIGDVVSGSSGSAFAPPVAGTVITAQLSGTPGSIGNYSVNISYITVASQTLQILHPSTWTVPADFGTVNKVEVIGGGGGGESNRGQGGGGGTYAITANVSLTPGASVGYVVGPGGTSVSLDTEAGSDTAFGLSNSGLALVGAKGGFYHDHGNTAQDPTWSNGDTVHIGGHTQDSASGLGGAAGGGAGGPHGVGGYGTSSPGFAGGGGGGADGGANGSGSNGGASFAGAAGGTGANPGNPGASGSGGGGGLVSSAGGDGSMEPMWTSNPGGVAAGPGSGGGAGAYNGAFGGGVGGGYGGGGGGGSYPTGLGGLGAQGIIVITDTPLAATAYARHQVWID